MILHQIAFFTTMKSFITTYILILFFYTQLILIQKLKIYNKQYYISVDSNFTLENNDELFHVKKINMYSYITSYIKETLI